MATRTDKPAYCKYDGGHKLTLDRAGGLRYDGCKSVQTAMKDPRRRHYGS